MRRAISLASGGIMAYRPRLALVVVSALVAGSYLCPLPAAARGLSTVYQRSLEQKLPPFNAIQKSFVEAILDIVYRYQIPFALEYVDLNATTKPLDFVLSRATVKTAIQAIVQHRTEYRVTFSGGIVDVYSPGARANPSNLLNTRIPRFDAQRADLALVGGMLYGALLSATGPPRGFGGSFAGVGGPPVAISVRGLRVFAILNMLVARQGHSVWVVSVPPAGLSRLNADLWHIYPLDPAQEPIVLGRLRSLFPRPGVGGR